MNDYPPEPLSTWPSVPFMGENPDPSRRPPEYLLMVETTSSTENAHLCKPNHEAIDWSEDVLSFESRDVATQTPTSTLATSTTLDGNPSLQQLPWMDTGQDIYNVPFSSSKRSHTGNEQDVVYEEPRHRPTQDAIRNVSSKWPTVKDNARQHTEFPSGRPMHPSGDWNFFGNDPALFEESSSNCMSNRSEVGRTFHGKQTKVGQQTLPKDCVQGNALQLYGFPNQDIDPLSVIDPELWPDVDDTLRWSSAESFGAPEATNLIDFLNSFKSKPYVTENNAVHEDTSPTNDFSASSSSPHGAKDSTSSDGLFENLDELIGERSHSTGCIYSLESMPLTDDPSASQFRCDACRYSCESRSSLNRHMRKHNKRFKCHIGSCSYACSAQKDLKRHQQSKKHRGLEQEILALYCCSQPDCAFNRNGFARKDHLTRHEKKVHGKESVVNQ